MIFTCKAVIFDLDGVLIDSDFIYERHWKRWAKQQNVSFEHILAIHHGRPAIRTMEIVAPHLDLEHEARLFNATLASDMNVDGVVAYDGSASLLDGLPLDRWAIATSAPRAIAVARLTYLGLPLPPVCITSDDVTRGKPAPDPYVFAARGLGQDPAGCMVVEDAPAGITSAKAAGARVIAISSTNPPDALRDADAIVDRLDNLEITHRDDQLQIRCDRVIHF